MQDNAQDNLYPTFMSPDFIQNLQRICSLNLYFSLQSVWLYMIFRKTVLKMLRNPRISDIIELERS